MHVGSTLDNDIKELDPRKAYKCLGIEESFDIQHKNEKEELKKEYLRRFRLLLLLLLLLLSVGFIPEENVWDLY